MDILTRTSNKIRKYNTSTYHKIQGGQRLVSSFNQSLFQIDLGYKIDYSQC